MSNQPKAAQSGGFWFVRSLSAGASGSAAGLLADYTLKRALLDSLTEAGVAQRVGSAAMEHQRNLALPTSCLIAAASPTLAEPHCRLKHKQKFILKPGAS
jgi:hypothetical protein